MSAAASESAGAPRTEAAPLSSRVRRRKLAAEMNVELLAEIPLVQSIRESGDDGMPAVMHVDSPAAKAFVQLAENMAQQLAMVNAGMETLV